MNEIKRVTAFGKLAMPIINNEHNSIHEGTFFTANVYDAALAAAALIYIEMQVPAGVEVHLKQTAFYNSDNGFYKLVEVSAYTPGSTPITPYNRHRSSVKTPGVILKQDPSGISGAALEEMAFDGTQQSPGILITNDWEWILKPDTNYVLSLKNEGSSASVALLKANWYERML